MSNTGSFVWKIHSHSDITKLLQAKVGESINSKTVEIAQLKWMSICYPNGTNETEKGSCMVLLRISNLPKQWKNMEIRLTIECIETAASFTSICTYTGSDDLWGWKTTCLLLSELKQLAPKQISFKISIQIIKITSKHNKQTLFYDIIPIESTQTISWDIDKNIMRQFKNAYYGKIFESETRNNSMFILQCSPQGTNKHYKGFVYLYLKLIHLPSPKAHKIKVHYSLYCPEKDITKKFIYSFCKDNNNWGAINLCAFSKLSPSLWASSISAQSASLTLMADIYILEVQDINGNIIPKNEWNQHEKQYDYDKCILEAISWKCSGCGSINTDQEALCSKCNALNLDSAVALNITDEKEEIQDNYFQAATENKNSDNLVEYVYPENQCRCCSKKFGAFLWKHSCQRCDEKVCDGCSGNRRYDYKKKGMVRICDKCLQCEERIEFKDRLKGIELYYDRQTRGSYVVNLDANRCEYALGMVNGCKVIAIDDKNVELQSAELIENKLKSVYVPFSMILDYRNAEHSYGDLQKLKEKAMDNNWLGLDRYVFMWQYLENDGKWKDAVYNIAMIMEEIQINEIAQYAMEYNSGKWIYTVMKKNEDECIQTNDATRNQRDVRRIIFDTQSNKRIVWQFESEHDGWTDIDQCDLTMKLIKLKKNKVMTFMRGPWNYVIKKIDDNNAIQTNTNSGRDRKLRMIIKDKEVMDERFQSKASTRNKQYAEAVNANQNQMACVCGSILTKTQLQNVYNEPFWMICNQCKQATKQKDEYIYHCNKGECDEHKDGYDLCTKCVEERNQNEINNPSDYVVTDDNEVILWLKNDLKMPQYIKMFIDNGFDEMNTVIHTLNQDILVQMEMKKIGHRKKIMFEIEKMNKEMHKMQVKENKMDNIFNPNDEYEIKCKPEKLTMVLSHISVHGPTDDIDDDNGEKKGIEKKDFIELSKVLQEDIENYQNDYLQRNKSGKIKQLQMFTALESQVIRTWNCLKSKYFGDLYEKLEEKYDDDSEEEIIYKLLFDLIIECYHVLYNQYITIKNEYIYGQSINIILLNIDLFYQHIVISKKQMRYKRFKNICDYLNDNILNKIRQRIGNKHKYDTDDIDINNFIIKCCSVLWNVIGYQYKIYPLIFKFKQIKYDGSIHERDGFYEGDIAEYCVFPAIQKNNAYHSKIWVICNDIDDEKQNK